LATGKCIGEKFTSFGDLITWVLAMILTIGSVIFFFILIWGGIRYMLARGDEKAVMEARSTLSNGFVGFLLMISTLVIIRLIAAVLFNSSNLLF
jgi:TRAP-type C4-dicarboxylate transport system permease small subunit